jgi:hypothetical protein
MAPALQEEARMLHRFSSRKSVLTIVTALSIAAAYVGPFHKMVWG